LERRFRRFWWRWLEKHRMVVQELQIKVLLVEMVIIYQNAGGGGGGAGAVGSNGIGNHLQIAGNGGNGLASSITGSSVNKSRWRWRCWKCRWRLVVLVEVVMVVPSAQFQELLEQ
jgi:hypothetical protein